MTTHFIAGFIFGILSAVFFALYMVPQKLTRLSTPIYLWWMSVGVLLAALIPYAIAGFPRHGTVHLWGLALLCGLIWGVGTMSFAAGIGRIGLALATPIKNTTGILGTLVGLVLLGEAKTINPWLCLIGSVLIVVSAILIGQAGNPTTPRRSSTAGVLYALGAAVCYASYLYPLKLVLIQIGPWEATPWMALGVLITATVVMLSQRGGARQTFSQPPRVAWLSMLGGVSWTVALLCLSGGITLANLSITWSLAQLNTIPAVFIGMSVFHEVHFGTHWRTITLGLLAATVGTLLLGFSK